MLTLSKLQEKAKWNTSTVSTGHDMTSTAVGRDKWIFLESAAIIWQWDCRANAPLYTPLAWAAEGYNLLLRAAESLMQLRLRQGTNDDLKRKKPEPLSSQRAWNITSFQSFVSRELHYYCSDHPRHQLPREQSSQTDSSHLFPQLMDHASFLAVDQHKYQVPLVQVSYPSIHLGRKWLGPPRYKCGIMISSMTDLTQG